MLEEVTCINYKIAIDDDNGNEFKVDKMCLEKETIGKKITYYARLDVVITEKHKEVLKKQFFFELEKLHEWLYSMYSIGSNRKKKITMQIDDSISVSLGILDEQNGELYIESKQSGFKFSLVTTIDKFRHFQSTWKRVVSYF